MSLALSRNAKWTNFSNGGPGKYYVACLDDNWISDIACRKIFGTSHREDLTPEVVSHMSVNALADQRKKLEDAAFDSD